MDFLLNRYRNLTVLLLVIVGQLLLLAYQVKSNQDVRLIRIWAVTAVTPLARVMEVVRRNTIGFVEDYFVLLDVREKNRQLNSEIGKLKLENQYLHSELQTADRARALAAFQSRSPSQTIAARIIGTGPGANSRVVFIDRGTASGVQKGMAVITPDGIVGKVVAAYPTASQVQLITDPNFAAGVISDKNRVHGTIKGQGHSTVMVDYVQNEENVEVGERFFTSGDDRVFPKGMPVGTVKVVRQGKAFNKEIYVEPSGFANGLEEVLVVVEGVHQPIPDPQAVAAQPVHLQSAPPVDPNEPASREGSETDADKLKQRYQKIGEMQNHTYGAGPIPNFNLNPDKAPATPRMATGATGSTGGSGARAAGTGATGGTGATVARPRGEVPGEITPSRPRAITGATGATTPATQRPRAPETVSEAPRLRPATGATGAPPFRPRPAETATEAPPRPRPIAGATGPTAAKPRATTGETGLPRLLPPPPPRKAPTVEQ